MEADDILKYMPDYYNDVYEMKMLLTAEGKVLKVDDDRQIRTLLNEFVTQADEKGISIFENELSIIPEEGSDLETRRNIVLLHMWPPRPITITYLRNLFNIMHIPVTITVDYNARHVDVEGERTDLTDQRIKTTVYTLNLYLPANLGYLVTVNLPRVSITRHWYVGWGTKTRARCTTGYNKDQAERIKQSVKRDWYVGLNAVARVNTVATQNRQQAESIKDQG